MARSPKKISGSKTRSGAKARGRTAAKKARASTKSASKAAASRKTTPAKKSASRSRSRGQARGRAAAKTATRSKKSASKRPASSRKSGAAKSASKRGSAQRSRRTENDNLSGAINNPMTEAMAVGTRVAAGAVQAGGEIVAATADIAKSAARTVAALTAGVPAANAEGSNQRRGGRKRS
jgi:hypothetical protein